MLPSLKFNRFTLRLSPRKSTDFGTSRDQSWSISLLCYFGDGIPVAAYKKNGRAAAWIDFRQSNAFARASKVRGLHIRAASTMQSIDRLLMRLETRLRIAGDGHGRCAPLPLCARRS